MIKMCENHPGYFVHEAVVSCPLCDQLTDYEAIISELKDEISELQDTIKDLEEALNDIQQQAQ